MSTYTTNDHVLFKDWHCHVQLAVYQHSKSLALRLVSAGDDSHIDGYDSPMQGEVIANCTIYVEEVEKLTNKRHIFIKDYSENQGMLRTLIDSGTIAPTGMVIETENLGIMPIMSYQGYIPETIEKELA